MTDFIGRANFPRAKWRPIDGPRATIDSAIGPIACEKKIGASPGTAVTVCIRPEFIGSSKAIHRVGATSSGEGSDPWSSSATPTRGVRVGQTLLIFRIEPTTAVREGEEIALHFDPRRCSILLN